jgi:threonyl-tRNA synthetase
MNCPFHTQIFDRKPHSYREMPQRYANTTMVYRDEQSGELAGLSRVRCITQDDAHVFCRKSQIKEEMFHIWDIIDEFYKAVGFNLYVRLSLSDPKSPEKYLGSREDWLEAEDILRQIGKTRGIELIEVEGEAAFYGPKLDFMAKDSLGREWQVATNQLDMNMPVRFGLTCTNEKGEAEQVYMLHAAIMGSIERYMGILIEHFAGAFPVWLSPVQAVIVPISQDHHDYAVKVAEELKKVEIRVEISAESESMQNRIRKAAKEKVPYILVVGATEMAEQTIAVRQRGNKNLGVMEIEKFKTIILDDIIEKKIW